MRIQFNNRKNVLSTNENNFVDVNLLSDQRELPYGDITRVINQNEIYQKERQESNKYRFVFKTNLYFSNVLLNNESFKLFNEGKFKTRSKYDNGYDFTLNEYTYEESLRENTYDIDGVIGYYDNLSNPIKFVELEPKPERVNINEDNWYIEITYPYKTETISDAVVNQDGIKIIDFKKVVLGDVDYIVIGCPVKHNLNVGDLIKINGFNNNELNKTYFIERLGDDELNYSEYYFAIKFDFLLFNNIITNVRFKKIISDYECEYYFRKFKKIKTSIKNVGNLKLEKTIYNGDVKQILFKDDYVIEEIDYLNRPLSEVYLTLIKKENDYFTKPLAGIEIPFQNYLLENDTTISDIRRIHNGGSLPFESHTPLEQVDYNNDYYGDIVEFDKFNYNETILSEIKHTFNSNDRLKEYSFKINRTNILNLDKRQEGYFYKPHNKIIINTFSEFVNRELFMNITDDDIIPNYKFNLNDLIIWRDLDEKGLFDITDYPFLNGFHYIFKMFNIHIKRQDPFGNVGLRYENLPKEIRGIKYDDDSDKEFIQAC